MKLRLDTSRLALGALLLDTSWSLACSPQTQNAQVEQPMEQLEPAAQEGSEPPASPQETLHSLALQGDAAALQAKLRSGADINQKDQYGSTPLMVAVTFGKDEAAKALMDAGADLSITNNEGSSPLHVAAFLCRTPIVEALLAAGADKNATNNAGRTPLDSVSAPFDDVKPVYDKLSSDLAPLGFSLDYEHLKQTRPKIAAMLQDVE